MTTSVRDLLVTLPDRLKARLARATRPSWKRLCCGLIDRYLARRDEERAPRLLDFDELPVLYDEADFPVVTGRGSWLARQFDAGSA